MSREKKIPKRAVNSLMEYCNQQGKELGTSAAEIFKSYLELMKEYADYFFSEPWPRTADKRFELSDVDEGFIKGGKSYREECKRFSTVCLRRNISLEGFNSEGFAEDFKFYGNRECWDCVVPDAVRLREDIERIEQAVRKNEEKMKQEEPSWIVKEMYEHYRRPDVARRNKMMLVELRLYEEMGCADDKSCGVKNKYRCPYGKQSEQLIEHGRLAKAVWQEIKWYNVHWNASPTYRPSVQEMKWYHYGEPGIIDVTSYEDVLKAIEDGRFEKVVEEHRRYMKETGSKAWAL